jgi:hypothetical protein
MGILGFARHGSEFGLSAWSTANERIYFMVVKGLTSWHCFREYESLL